MGWKMSDGGGAEPSNPSILSLSTSLSVSYYRESWIMCWNQVENEKKKKFEKESWRKKEIGRFWKVESRERKKGEDRDIWVYVCGGEKSREKKKKTYG